MRINLLGLETAECIELAPIKTFCRVDINADDTLIEDVFVPAAREFVNNYINDITVPQSVVVYFDACKDRNWYDNKRNVVLPYKNVIEVTSIKFYDEDNSETTFGSDNYILAGNRIVLNKNASWPTSLREFDSVAIEFIAGFGEYNEEDPPAIVETVPTSIKIAMQQIIAHWLEQREANSEIDFKNVPINATAILFPYKNFTL